MKRPYSFEDIRGHSGTISYLKERLEQGTLSHFIIFEGPEGLGKTSIADILALKLTCNTEESYKRCYDDVVTKNGSSTYIKRFQCSVNGGKDVAREIHDEIRNNMNKNHNKVIICDECHGLTEAAQDVFLSDTEFITNNVYVFMLTTEVTKLKASLRSRAITIHLEPLKRQEMISLLKDEIDSRHLKVANVDAVVQLVADWAENKPRTGLNVLNAFANNAVVTPETIRSLIGYLDIREVLPLLNSLSGSMTFGLNYISNMAINNSLTTLVSECIQIKAGQPSYRLKLADVQLTRHELQDVTIDQLVLFLYGLTEHQRLTRSSIVHAYIRAHSRFSTLEKSNPTETLAIESAQRANAAITTAPPKKRDAPSLDDLLNNSAIVE